MIRSLLEGSARLLLSRGWLVIFGVSASLSGADLHAARTCSVVVSPMVFAGYRPATPIPVDSTGLISVTCRGNPDTGGAEFYTLGIGGGSSGNPAARYLASGTDRLEYNLYQDAAFTLVWGDGSGGSSIVVQSLPAVRAANGRVTQRGRPIRMDHTVYGRTFSNQDPRPGVYADAPLVTIEF
ncbi:MAG TPA: spore coat U domain-containing protein [Gammaproteobacteria bacterium]